MSSVEEAVTALRAGQAVILPTDTVYGVVADGYRGFELKSAVPVTV